ncbi:hypothetical protein [Moraxella nasicaprae]|uniref:Uncharacterized protein n=1 Tax=Moraxella nasicaprae TaxID=2904122 RepID=A0ABY6F3E7_9GAMM|nr:hypothetical protein [Moraxella nasicaprae]UXZ04517.1 hypothetical protein LU297_08010 [Moraxella nasicaprae]
MANTTIIVAHQSSKYQAIFVSIVMIMMILGTHGSMLTNHLQQKTNQTLLSSLWLMQDE